MGFAKALSPVIKVVLAVVKVIGRVLKIMFAFITNPLKFIFDTITGKNAELFDIASLLKEIEATNESLDRIFGLLEEETAENKIQRINNVFASIGKDLSMGAWSPPVTAVKSTNKTNQPNPMGGNTQQKMNRGMGGGGGITG